MMIHSLPLAPALYVFGDSLLDSGNNNLLPTLAKADYLPYGVDFAKGATGRFTNGRTVADYIAEFLGLPYSPPFMSTVEGPPTSHQLTGLNYASGSCGILPESGSVYGKCLNLNDQIDLFERTVKSELPKHYVHGSNELSEYLSKSIFIFSIGSNDYINNYLEPDSYSTSEKYPPQPFAQLLIDTLAKGFQKLYSLGARKVVMFEIGPIGCSPAFTRTQKHNGQCVNETNQMVSFFNQRLPALLSNLTSTLQGSTFVLGEANLLAYDAIRNPSKYGLADSSSPCCTTWENGTSLCIPSLLTPCPDAYKRFFCDAFHFTEPVSSIIAARCFNTSTCSPFNIKELVQV